MSHPDDEGNSVVRRAFSAVRKLREGKSGSGADAVRRPAAPTTSPAGQDKQGGLLPQEKLDDGSAQGAVNDSADSPVTEPTSATAEPESAPVTGGDSAGHPEASVEPDTETAVTENVDVADEGASATPDTAETAETDPVVDAVVNQAPAAETAESSGTVAESAENDVEEPAPTDEQAAASAEPTQTSGDVEQPAESEDESAPAPDPHADEPVADQAANSQTVDSQTAELPVEQEAAPDSPEEPPVQTTPDLTAAEAAHADEKTDATDEAAPDEKEPAQDTAGEQPGGDPAPAPSEAVTSQFAAVPAVSTSKSSPPRSDASNEDEPVGSPADENETDVIAAAPTPAEITDEPTERISTTKAAPASSSDSNTGSPPARVPDWKAEPAAPQYIPPAGGTQQGRTGTGPKKSRKGLWFALAALVLIAAVVAAVVAVVASGDETSEVPADVAAERALEYTTALRDGDIITLRQITCGEAQQRFTSMSDQEFAEDHRIQEQNNELVGVDGVKASKIVNDGNGAVVEVVAYKTLTPDEKLDVALTLSKIDGEWKVCKA